MKLTPTPEQELIIANAEEGRNLAISALAGSAKTTTCQMIAKRLRKHSLYVSYNKAIAMEAGTKFPKMWVECKTMHSLAWQAVVKGTKYGSKLGGFIDRNDVMEVIPDLRSMSYQNRVVAIGKITDAIGDFCNSAEPSIQNFCDTKLKGATLNFRVRQVWDAMIDVNNPMGITHDVYLKLFQLSKPDLGYRIIYYDEAQDANAATLDIIKRQDAQIIIVGDTHQNIYSFNNTINAFDHLDDDYSLLELTTSFRFPQHIADNANRVLDLLGSSSKLIGKGTTTEIKTKAILVRTNLDLFSYLAGFAEQGLKSYAVGDLAELFRQLYSANNLKYNGDPSKRTDKLVKSYSTWDELVADVEYRPELAKLVGILNNFPNLHQTITNIKSMMVSDELDADTTLVTAHKSKGLEFDEVELAHGFVHWTDIRDFKEGEKTAKQIMNTDDTGRLIYVAMTRGKVRVDLPSDIKLILDLEG